MSTTVYPRDSFHLEIHMRNCNYFVINLSHSRRMVLERQVTKRFDGLELRGRKMQRTESSANTVVYFWQGRGQSWQIIKDLLSWKPQMLFPPLMVVPSRMALICTKVCVKMLAGCFFFFSQPIKSLICGIFVVVTSKAQNKVSRTARLLSFYLNLTSKQQTGSQGPRLPRRAILAFL